MIVEICWALMEGRNNIIFNDTSHSIKVCSIYHSCTVLWTCILSDNELLLDGDSWNNIHLTSPTTFWRDAIPAVASQIGSKTRRDMRREGEWDSEDWSFEEIEPSHLPPNVASLIFFPSSWCVLSSSYYSTVNLL